MEETKSLYVNDTLPRPKTWTEQHWDDLPWFFNNRNEGRRRWKNRFDSEENYQDKLKNLYRMATEVDAVVGAVVEELKEQGVYNNTLLIFTTDNGNLHGEHGLAEKWYPWEESIRVPLVVQDPRMPENQRGTRNAEFTLSVDLAPTILSAAGIPVPSYMQGRDFAQLYMNPLETAKTWRQGFFFVIVFFLNFLIILIVVTLVFSLPVLVKNILGRISFTNGHKERTMLAWVMAPSITFQLSLP